MVMMVRSTFEKMKKRYPLLTKKEFVVDVVAEEFPESTDIHIWLRGGYEIHIVEWLDEGRKVIEVLSDKYCRTFNTYKQVNEFLKSVVKY